MTPMVREQLALYGLKEKKQVVKPFLKWAGGKRQLLPVIKKLLPPTYETYYEPFVGAGAVLFNLKPLSAVINDVNSELINCYKVVRDNSTALIEDLAGHQNSEEYFYKLRELDRGGEFDRMSDIERASRIIYLNKTCFNGLFRVNRQGQFNAPFGRYKDPKIVNAEVILGDSDYLMNNDVQILNHDFVRATETAQRGDFVYLDPPYDPVSDTSSFTGYSLNQFGRTEQERLRDLFENLTLRGCLVMLSNSATNFIENLYEDYNVIKVQANRSINSVGTGRQKIDEFLILNYVP
jgi:DNA adenine methylase